MLVSDLEWVRRSVTMLVHQLVIEWALLTAHQLVLASGLELDHLLGCQLEHRSVTE